MPSKLGCYWVIIWQYMPSKGKLHIFYTCIVIMFLANFESI